GYVNLVVSLHPERPPSATPGRMVPHPSFTHNANLAGNAGFTRSDVPARQPQSRRSIPHSSFRTLWPAEPDHSSPGSLPAGDSLRESTALRHANENQFARHRDNPARDTPEAPTLPPPGVARRSTSPVTRSAPGARNRVSPPGYRQIARWGSPAPR